MRWRRRDSPQRLSERARGWGRRRRRTLTSGREGGREKGQPGAGAEVRVRSPPGATWRTGVFPDPTPRSRPEERVFFTCFSLLRKLYFRGNIPEPSLELYKEITA